MLHLLNRMNVPINRLALEALQLKPDDLVLEIGFGGGSLLADMSRSLIRGKAYGIDYSQDAVDACSRRFTKQINDGAMELHCGTVTTLPFKEETFWKVCTVNTIYFWSDLRGAISEIYRVLKAGGNVVVCFSTKSSMQDRAHLLPGFLLYDPEDVVTILTAAGFRNVHCVARGNGSDECVAVTGTR